MQGSLAESSRSAANRWRRPMAVGRERCQSDQAGKRNAAVGRCGWIHGGFLVWQRQWADQRGRGLEGQGEMGKWLAPLDAGGISRNQEKGPADHAQHSHT